MDTGIPNQVAGASEALKGEKVTHFLSLSESSLSLLEPLDQWLSCNVCLSLLETRSERPPPPLNPKHSPLNRQP